MDVDTVIVAQGLTKTKIIVITTGVYKILAVINQFLIDPTVLNILTAARLLIIVAKGLVRIVSIVPIIVGDAIHAGQRY